jgi:hypothetical protein
MAIPYVALVYLRESPRKAYESIKPDKYSAAKL